MLLVWDPDQLIPVCDHFIWGPNISEILDIQIKSLWGLFGLFFRLNYNYYTNCDVPNAVVFDSFMDWLCDGLKIDADWSIV